MCIIYSVVACENSVCRPDNLGSCSVLSSIGYLSYLEQVLLLSVQLLTTNIVVYENENKDLQSTLHLFILTLYSRKSIICTVCMLDSFRFVLFNNGFYFLVEIPL